MATEFRAPAYVWIGNVNEGDQVSPSGLFSCSSCGSVVEGSTEVQHTEFHKAIAVLAQKVKELDDDVSDILEA